VGGRAGANDDRTANGRRTEEHQKGCERGKTKEDDRASAGEDPHGARQARREGGGEGTMIRKLKSGEYRLYSRKKDPKSGKRRNLGTFKSLAAAQKHERAVQFFKRH
jgi:hypothetical protein